MQFKSRLRASAAVLSFAATVGLGIESSAVAGGVEAPAPVLSGFYISAGVGGAGFQAANSNFSTTVTGSTTVGTIQLLPKNSLNFAWFAGIGYQINPVFRLDLMYLNFGLPLYGFAVNTNPSLNQNNYINALGTSNMGFLDAYLDVMSLFGRSDGLFEPYFGGGVGFSSNEMSNISTTLFFPSVVNNVASNTHTDFAWRIIVGLNFPITRHLQAFTQYSYISAGKYTFGNTLNGVSTPSTTGILPIASSFNIYSNMLSAGLTYLF